MAVSAISDGSSFKEMSSGWLSKELARILSRTVLAASAFKCRKDPPEDMLRYFHDFLSRPI